MTLTRKQIGTVAVDTGSILLVDPCYAKKVDDHEYQRILDVANKPGFEGGVILASNGLPLGTVFATRQGDGIFPVFAECDEQGKLVRVTIEMKE